jgi:hypothetical protein
MQILRDHGDHLTVAPLIVDLVAWKPTQCEFLRTACTEAGTDLIAEKCCPVAGQPTWSSLDDAYAWPQPEVETSVITRSPPRRMVIRSLSR